MIFRRKDRNGAVAAPPTEEILAEIEALTAENRERRDADLERRLLHLRHRAGRALTSTQNGAGGASPDDRSLPESETLPEIAAADLTPQLLRAGILRDGCVLVRGLVDGSDATALAAEIEQALVARDAKSAGDEAEPGLYEEFEGTEEEKGGLIAREWVSEAGLWAADSPRVMFSMIESFERNGLRTLITEYLGETPALSVQKCTLRKVQPDTGGAWHQDGAFLGEVNALNVWVALNRCGDVSPGLDIVPRRLDHIVPTGTDGAMFDWSVAPDVAREAALDKPILRPIFEAGDGLMFDDLFLHATGADPSMNRPRYAVESWFFGASGFPSEYVPLAY